MRGKVDRKRHVILMDEKVYVITAFLEVNDPLIPPTDGFKVEYKLINKVMLYLKLTTRKTHTGKVKVYISPISLSLGALSIKGVGDHGFPHTSFFCSS